MLKGANRKFDEASITGSLPTKRKTSELNRKSVLSVASWT